MTSKTYDLFMATNPTLKSHSRRVEEAKVTIGFVCSEEHREGLEKFTRTCKEEGYTVEITKEAEKLIYFTVSSDNYEFNDRIMVDFFKL